MKTKKEEDFEFLKEKNDQKKNYIFKKDSITKIGFYITAAILIFLIIITVYYGLESIE